MISRTSMRIAALLLAILFTLQIFGQGNI